VAVRRMRRPFLDMLEEVFSAYLPMPQPFPPAPIMPIIASNALSVSLSGRVILSDIDLAVERGEWLGLVGPNGSGKTTLLRTLSGVLPYAGSLDMLDRPVRTWNNRERARHLALVRQTRTVSFDFQVDELVLLGRSPYKGLLATYDRTDRERVHDALRLVDLEGCAERSFASLSGGEQQRVFLAQALVQEADILLLDEPTTYLDVHHQYEFMHHVRRLVDEGITVVGAFHDLELAAHFSDRMAVLDGGRLVATGAPVEVLTEDLLRRVFRMESHVTTAGDERLYIRFDRPSVR